jgi:hypothetical protein
MGALETLNAAVLAHQGGWDEMLMVVVPVGAFAGLLYIANRRASKLGERPPRDDDAAPGVERTHRGPL